MFTNTDISSYLNVQCLSIKPKSKQTSKKANKS